MRLSSERLVQEAEAIDVEIRDSKRRILRSALKKERIELLHKNLYRKSLEEEEEEEEEEEVAPDVGGAVLLRMGRRRRRRRRRVGTGKGEGPSSERALKLELSQLNQEILSQKRQLLRVVKHIEEGRADSD